MRAAACFCQQTTKFTYCSKFSSPILHSMDCCCENTRQLASTGLLFMYICSNPNLRSVKAGLNNEEEPQKVKKYCLYDSLHSASQSIDTIGCCIGQCVFYDHALDAV